LGPPRTERVDGPSGVMILSEQKGVLSVCALVAGLGAALALALSVRLVFGRPASSWLEPATISQGMLAVVSFLVTMLLMTEHTRATRSGGTRAGALPRAAGRSPMQSATAPVL